MVLGMADEFSQRSLAGARFHKVDLAGATFEQVSLAGARFDDADFSGVKIRGALLRDVDIGGELEGLRINGINEEWWHRQFAERDLDALKGAE